MDGIVCREARFGDLDDIAEISSLTWEGDDYLGGSAGAWITDGTLRVGEMDGRVIGTFRISPMPCGVIWMEALRVHPEYRGRGLGRRLGGEAFRIGREMMSAGAGDCLEFSTYVNNMESIHISTSQGFRVVNRFMLMSREGAEPGDGAVATKPSPDDFREVGEHIPCGWKFPRSCPEGVEWSLRECQAYRYGDVLLLRKKGSDETTPIAGSRLNPEGFLDGAESVASAAGDGHTCIVVHESRTDVIRLARARGYGTWEPTDGFNVLVFRFGP
jgi:ribosomal protein S18 acetylase RimI-like enzyme